MHINQMPFVLEVVRFVSDREEWKAKGVKKEHVGYIQARFETKEEAAAYYDRHNPHMRKLNAHGTWTSDWDHRTRLLFIVREDDPHVIDKSISPFEE